MADSQTNKKRSYRIAVVLAGETVMPLCEADDLEAMLAVVTALCRPERPAYGRVIVELYEPLSEAR